MNIVETLWFSTLWLELETNAANIFYGSTESSIRSGKKKKL